MRSILILALTCLTACTSNKFTINGKVGGAEGYAYLTDIALRTIDSAQVVNGEFHFEGVAEPTSINHIILNEQSENTATTLFFLEPGKIAIVGNVEAPRAIKASGTQSNDASNAYWKRVQELEDSYKKSYTSVTPDQRAAIEDQIADITRKAVDDNNNNFFGAILFTKKLTSVLSGEEQFQIMDKFPEHIKKSDIIRMVKKDAAYKLRTDPGRPYVNITQNSPEGVPVSLKSVVETPGNKYVFVNFWAAWSRPSMSDMIFYTRAYDEFHDKGFEIYSVALDSDKELWINTIKDRNIKGIQVSDLKRLECDAIHDYSIKSMPYNVLIDCATGNIIAINLYRSALSNKLKELLK